MLNINFIKYHKIALIFSVILVFISFISFFTKFLNLGIDFTGGILIESRFEKKVEISNLRSILSNS